MQQVLASLNPVAISAIFVAIVLAATRLAPYTRPFWTFFPKVVQAWLPSVVAGLPVALNAFGAVKTWLDFTQAVLVVAAIAVPFAVPGMSSPHNHPDVPPAASDKKPPTGVTGSLAGAALLLLGIGLSLHATGCAWFKGSFWPNVEKCAPSPAALIAQVGQLLAAGGDYETALEQLALTDGKDIVLCAVQAFVNSIGSKVGASPEELAAVARGKAFLAEHPVGQ